MLKNALKIVLSGGPGVGKTSILNELKRRGYAVRKEVFTDLFTRAQAENKFDELFNDKSRLIHELIALQENEENIESSLKNEVIFFDRGMVDILGFAKEIEHELSKETLDHLHSFSYDLCVLPQPLALQFYEQNTIRRQTATDALKRHSMITHFYTQHFKSKNRKINKCILEVPNFIDELDFFNGNKEEFIEYSVQKRVEFILNQIRV